MSIENESMEFRAAKLKTKADAYAGEENGVAKYNENILKEVVNEGNPYKAADFLTADSLNRIVEGVMYNLEKVEEFDNQVAPANTVLAGPESGGAGPTAFRKLTPKDMPSLSSGGWEGILPVRNGGTGRSSIEKNALLIGNSNGDGFDNIMVNASYALKDSNDNDIGGNLISMKGMLDILAKTNQANTIEIPVYGKTSEGKEEWKRLVLQYGKVEMEKGVNNHKEIGLKIDYANTDYSVFVTAGRSSADGNGVDTVYAYTVGSKQFKIVKDYRVSEHKLDVWWMTIGFKDGLK